DHTKPAPSAPRGGVVRGPSRRENVTNLPIFPTIRPLPASFPTLSPLAKIIAEPHPPVFQAVPPAQFLGGDPPRLPLGRLLRRPPAWRRRRGGVRPARRAT